ncbi:MAG: hypothetical protein JRZ95_02780 [Nitrososphaerota archaeon]|jgi:hypothetical protein|nr:hypothetical protein [Nitrososphaerota archaeon]
MAVERARTEIDYLIRDIENFVESLKNDENPYNPRFGTSIEYLEGSILPALKSIEKALENP